MQLANIEDASNWYIREIVVWVLDLVAILVSTMIDAFNVKLRSI